jgi:hypothetical protein
LIDQHAQKNWTNESTNLSSNNKMQQPENTKFVINEVCEMKAFFAAACNTAC